jgi:hypothetical protein
LGVTSLVSFAGGIQFSCGFGAATADAAS